MEVKFNCSNPDCRRRIAVDAALLGKAFTCPACGTIQQVPSSTTIKFSCTHPGCGQHMVVDVVESGRFLKCPGCGKPLRVPGALPMPFANKEATAKESTLSGAKNDKASNRILLAGLRLLCGWGVGACVVMLLWCGPKVREQAALPANLDKMSDELFFNGRILDAPVESNDGSMMLFAQEVKEGIGIFLVNLTTLSRKQIGFVNSQDIRGERSYKLFGWSPEDRWIAYSVMARNVSTNKPIQRITICDGASGEVKNASQNKGSSIENGVWLTTNTLALVNNSSKLLLYNLEDNPSQPRFGKKGMNVWGQLRSSGPPLRISDNLIAYAAVGGTIDLFDVFLNRNWQLVRPGTAKIEWLDYCPGNKKLLFCTKNKEEATNCFVYEIPCTPDASLKPLQRSFTYSLKGQWINCGNDIAYVTTVGEKTSLVIDSGDETIKTNVFGGGSIRSYSVTPKRDKVYAVASRINKIQSIWEYDIKTKSFRDVLPVEDRTTRYSTTEAPINAIVTNQLNERVDYYFIPPAHMEPTKKYPAIMDLYPVNRYDQNAQMLVNAGIYYVAANRFGLNDWTAVSKPEDVLAIYTNLLSNPNIDSARIYIYGRSFSTSGVTEVIEGHPQLWRGVILFSPVSFPEISPSNVGCRSLFIAEGDEDAGALQKNCFRLWQNASERLIAARIHIEHAGHGFSAENYKNSYKSLVEFILTDF